MTCESRNEKAVCANEENFKQKSVCGYVRASYVPRGLGGGGAGEGAGRGYT